MKKKIFTLLTLLLCVCSGAWADSESHVADEASVVAYNGTAFSFANSKSCNSSIATDANQATATDDNTLKFSKAFFPNGSSNGEDKGFTITAKKDLSSLKIYYTCSDGSFTSSKNYSKSGNLMYKIGDNEAVTSTTTSNKSNATAYVETISNINKDDVIKIYSSTNRLVIFAVYATYSGDPTSVATPNINFSSNQLNITCSTTGAAIYYTTDGSEPTTSSNLFSSAVDLTNSCTVRAKAFNTVEEVEYTSSEATFDCYVDNSSTNKFLGILGYNGGELSEGNSVWTSSDGDYKLTDNMYKTNTSYVIGYASLAGTQDGFKLNANDTYNLDIDSDIKITKIVVVGKSWLSSYAAASMSITGFNGNEATAFYGFDDDKTYVKTIEFTPNNELDYGQGVVINTATNQIGCYIEVYGEKRQGPAAPEAALGDAITWDFTDLTAKDFGNGESASYKADNGTTEMRFTAKNSDDKIIAKDGTTPGYLKENGTSANISGKDIDGETAIGKSRLIRLFVTGKGVLRINCNSAIGVYNVYNSNATNTASDGESALITGYTANTNSSTINVTNGLWIETTTKGYITSISWTPLSENDITLATNAIMEGYRSFYDGTYNYEVAASDENTKIYVAAKKDETHVTMTEIPNIPAGIPVILKTTTGGTITLTKKATLDSPWTGSNLLQHSTAGQNFSVVGAYRLGAGGDIGVGFYEWITTSAEAGIVYLPASAFANESRSISMVFEDETTGIEAISNTQETAKGTREYYNLNGQRVANPTKGLYIVNGKKVIIK